MVEHTTRPSPTQAHAYLGVAQAHHVFRFNPDTVNWGYKENTVSRDTIGGRVVQLLSVMVTGISVQGKAGSREELQTMSENVRQIMEYHIKTLRPVTFRVPSRRWDFKVYVTAMPQIGWDVSSTSYPYQLQLEVEEDLTGVKVRDIEATALFRLYEGIGYNPSLHGGDPKGFEKTVKTVLKASQGYPNYSNTNTSGPVSKFYKDPFRDATYSAARIDAGVDYCGSGPVYAIGPAVITHAGTPSNTSTFGSDMSVYRLTSGPAAGKYVFFAEHYNNAPALRDGAIVDSNTVLYNMNGGCIEIGWSDGNGSIAWDQAPGSIEGQLTAFGKNFNELLVALGTKPGLVLSRPVSGTLPPGWPTSWKGKV
jgi:hypothetical protein